MFAPRLPLAILALLLACARNDPAGEVPARADGFAVADTTGFQPALAVSGPECPLDLLIVPDSVRLDSARALGIYADVEPELFCFALADGIYEIKNDGTGRRANPRDTTTFRITWQDADSTGLERLLVRPYEGDLLIALQYTDGDGAAGELTRLERAGLRQRWRADIPAFNIGAPLVDGATAYVTAVGFVGRVDLGGGKYDWRFDDLYDRATGHFTWVESITLRGDTVAFAGVAPGRAPRILLVHRETGAVLGRREGDDDPDRPHN